MSNPPSSAEFRKYAYKQLKRAGLDWRERLADQWFLFCPQAGGESMPVLLAPARWLMTAERYVRVDAGDPDDIHIDYISAGRTTCVQYLHLVHYLERQIRMDDELSAIAAASA